MPQWSKHIVNKHCTQTALFTLYTVNCKVYIVHYTLYTTMYTVHSTNCSLYSVLCTLYSVFWTLYSVLCTLYYVLCTLYSVLCSLLTTLSFQGSPLDKEGTLNFNSFKLNCILPTSTELQSTALVCTKLNITTLHSTSLYCTALNLTALHLQVIYNLFSAGSVFPSLALNPSYSSLGQWSLSKSDRFCADIISVWENMRKEMCKDIKRMQNSWTKPG